MTHARHARAHRPLAVSLLAMRRSPSSWCWRCCRRSSTSIRPQLLIYGLIFAIAALGFNLLLGYTGLLSFGHSAYFGTGAYTVAFIVRDLGVQSHGAVHPRRPRSARSLISALFGFVCVRHTRIFFGILTLALSQVLWSLAFKFFWVTGGTDGIRVAVATSSRCSAA